MSRARMEAPTGRLLHYTAQQLGKVSDTPQAACWPNGGEPGKPDGLWVSVEGPDDWFEWCSSDWPDWLKKNGKYTYEIKLVPGSTIWAATSISTSPGTRWRKTTTGSSSRLTCGRGG